MSNEDKCDPMPPKLQESTSAGFKDRSKRRLSLPLSGKDARRTSIDNKRRPSLSSNSSCSSWSSTDDDEDFPPPRERPQANSSGFSAFCVRDVSRHALGRREIELARAEMPGILALRAGGAGRPLEGAKVAGCSHINSQTAVMIETLVAMGAEVRWSSCNIFSTQNEVAAALAESNISIYAWRGQSEADFWWCIEQCLQFQPDLILDDGGDMTHVLVSKFPQSFRGVVEESLTGVHRLYQLCQGNKLSAPAMNTHDSVTKSMFDNYYCQRESVVDALKRCTEVLLAGKNVLVCGYGQVGKGCCAALKGACCNVVVSEVDPICALMACMEGFRVRRVENAVKWADIVITATGNKRVITRDHMESMRNGCVLANMGHSNTEIDVQSIRTPEMAWERIRPNVDHVIFPSQKRLILLAEGRLLNLAATSMPSLITSVNACTQVLALVELYTAPKDRYKAAEVYLLPKRIDEYVAGLHLTGFGANLTEMTEAQAHYVGVPKAGPYKPQFYRY